MMLQGVCACQLELVNKIERTLAYLSLYTCVSAYIYAYFILSCVPFADYLSSYLTVYCAVSISCISSIAPSIHVSVGQKHRITNRVVIIPTNNTTDITILSKLFM